MTLSTTHCHHRLVAATVKSASPPANPLIVIIGATGTGKSNLAVSIASSLTPPGEIVNADAMQLYAGLPIITNKIPVEEQKGIPHHLLGAISLDEEPWAVTKFVQECDGVIERIRARGKIPVVVGGTGYYVHGLLMKDATTLQGADGGASDSNVRAKDVDEELHKSDNMKNSEKTTVNNEDRLRILDAPTEEIYAKLQEVDPLTAHRWHPRDRRKIQRSLEIWLKTGRTASEVYAEQEQTKVTRVRSIDDMGGLEIGTETIQNQHMRYSPLIFWLDSEDAPLKERLNKRVDAMVDNGLVTEAKEMAVYDQAMIEKGFVLDKTKGIWASIGYKELEPWLDLVQRADSDESSQAAASVLKSCIEAVKAGTRRYAKRQNRYIRIRFANALADANASGKLFLLDCTSLDKWSETVEQPSHMIVNTFLHGETLPEPAELSEFAHRTFGNMSGTTRQSADARVARRCEDCDKVLMTAEEWTRHITSRPHKKTVQAIRKRSLGHGPDPGHKSNGMDNEYT